MIHTTIQKHHISSALCSLFIFIFACCVHLQAKPTLKLRTFTMLDGLPSNNITAFATSPNGMIWIATWNGICNYDGYRFNSFVSPVWGGQSTISNRLRQMVPTDNGDVWLSTIDSHLYLLSGKEGRYIDYTDELKRLGLADFEVSAIKSLSNGAVWILGKNGQNLRIHAGKQEVVAMNEEEAEPCRKVMLTNDGNEWMMGEKTIKRFGDKRNIAVRSREVYKTSQGIIIVGKGFSHYDIKTEKLTAIPLPDGMQKIEDSRQLSDGSIAIATGKSIYLLKGKKFIYVCDLASTDIHKDNKDRLWSTCDDGTAVMVDIKNKQQRLFRFELPAGFPTLEHKRTIIHEDAEGEIYILVPGKTIYYYNAATKSFEPYQLDEKLTIELTGTDRQKNLWLCSAYNLCQLTFHRHSFHFVPITQGEETRAVLADSNGRNWAGTRDGHIAVLDEEGKQCCYLRRDGSLSPTPVRFCNKGIYSIYEDRQHNIWIGTRGDGLYEITMSGTAVADINHYTKSNSGINADDFFDIMEDITGRLWFAAYNTSTMMFRDKGDTDFQFVSFNLKEKDDQQLLVRNISNATDGTILLSTTKGLLTINPHFSSPNMVKVYRSDYIPDDTTALMSQDVFKTLVCRKSKLIYVATANGPVQTIASENLTADNLKFHIANNSINVQLGNIKAMLEDDNGGIWIVGENIISNINRETERVFSTDNWGRYLEFVEAKPSVTNGRVILATNNGVIIFKPNNIKTSQFKPSIAFSGILYQGNERIVPLTGNHEVTLSTDKHNAIVYFSALDYCNNSQIRYAYRIKELNNEWIYVGNEHCASLSNMPSGHYTLEVRSTNSDGTWIDNNAEMKIYVEPTFWQTPWAWIIYLILGCVLLYSVVYMIWLRKAHRMEKEMNERQLRFFTDISHQLRTPLTLIGGPVTEVLNTEQLSEKATNLLTAVENNASKMLALINKTLDLKKLQLLNEEAETSSPEHPFSPAVSSQPSSPHPYPAASSQIFEDLTILIVEDNDELRYFLKTSLASRYNIIEAENGKVGLRLAAKHQPDFIITDIMMPEMDGITMIRYIKRDRNICHIPIIILSARTADVYRIEGLQEGADDYITKPFSVSYLQVRLESIVRQRRMLQEEWRNSIATTEEYSSDQDMTTKPTSEMSSIDLLFIQAFNKYLNESFSNANLKIDDIAHALSISRSVLYRKIKSIYGLTPNDILRNKRTTCAHQMLKTDFKKNIAEVSYACGFADPKYFAKVFKQAYGITPTDFRKSVATS